MIQRCHESDIKYYENGFVKGEYKKCACVYVCEKERIKNYCESTEGIKEDANTVAKTAMAKSIHTE